MRRFTKKTYSRHSYAEAVRRGDRFAKLLNERCGELIELRKQLIAIAKVAVAAEHGPQFFNPLEAMAAMALAKRILGEKLLRKPG